MKMSIGQMGRRVLGFAVAATVLAAAGAAIEPYRITFLSPSAAETKRRSCTR